MSVKKVRRKEQTPVDDVRRVREQLSADAGHDINRLCDRAREVTEKLRKSLGLKRAKPYRTVG